VVARLHHPHIVQIFEVGEYQGKPYLVLEFLDGGTLHQRIKECPLTPLAAAELVAHLADGVQHAHERGIIHRDLKPQNVLLSKSGIPRLADFGLAKLEDNRELSQTGQVMGTPCYMSPEQARGEAKAVSPAADIYGLGAILYECLTGRPPFQGPNSFEIIQQVLADDPVSPRALQPSIPRDLETICLKCLQKEPARRYASADELADDLRRFRDHRPIRARPVGPIERAIRWTRRRPGAAALIVLGVVCLGLLLAGIRYRELAQATARLAEANANLVRTEQYYKTLSQIRERSVSRPQGWSWDNLRLLRETTEYSHRDQTELRTLALQAATSLDLRKIAEFTEIIPVAVAFSADGKRLAIARKGDAISCSVHVYDVATQQQVAKYSFSNAAVAARINLMHLTSGKFAGAPVDQPHALTFSPYGRWLVAGTKRGQLVVWDTTKTQETPTVIRELYRVKNSEEGGAKKDRVEKVFFSPDGKEVFACLPRVPLTSCWDVEAGWREKMGGPYRAARFANISPDGQWLAYHDDSLRVLHRRSGDSEVVGRHPHWADTLFTPNNETLFIVDYYSHALNQIDRVSFQGVRTQFLSDRLGAIGHQLALPRDAQYVVTSSEDAVRFWEATGERVLHALPTSTVSGGIRQARSAISLDGNWLAVTGENKTTLYEVRSSLLSRIVAQSPSQVQAIDVSPDGSSLAVNLGHTATIWDPSDGRLIRKVKAQIMHTAPTIGLPSIGTARYEIAWHPDNDRIAWCSSWLGLTQISRSKGFQGLFSTKGIVNTDADSSRGMPETVLVPPGRFTPLSAEKLEVAGDSLAVRGQAIRLAPGQSAAVKLGELVDRGLKGGEYLVGFFVRVERKGDFQTGVAFVTALLAEGRKSQEGHTGPWRIPDGSYHFYTVGRWTGQELRKRAGEQLTIRNFDSGDRVQAIWVNGLAAIPINKQGRTGNSAHECGPLRYSPDGRELWGISDYQHIVWDASTREVRQVWDNRLTTFFAGTNARLQALDTKAGRTVASNLLGNLILTRHGTNQREVVEGPNEPLLAVAILGEGGSVAAGNSEGKIRVLSLENGQAITEVTAHQLGIMSLAYCEELQLLVSGSRDRSVVLWRWHNDQLQEVARLSNLPQMVRSVRLDAAGRRLCVLLELENAVRVWDLEQIRRLWAEMGLDPWANGHR
jgi:WD40 repeat protein